MATKQFTPHAVRTLKKNPNVVKCTPSKIIFTEAFALKVMDAVKKGEDPLPVFTANGLSVRILGKPRIMGAVGLWKSRYGLEGLPRRKAPARPKKIVETAEQRRKRQLGEAVLKVDALLKDPTQIKNLPANADNDTTHFAAIYQVYNNGKCPVIVKDLCGYYGYSYIQYYGFLKTKEPQDQDEYVNILNPHRKK
ncbi:MAG: hypothetical protein LKM30_05400 [Bacilli bacterium]|jgi:hypothetical protein|nr:hypothetical protein [Bacilli bacterium]